LGVTGFRIGEWRIGECRAGGEGGDAADRCTHGYGGEGAECD
jgi:hypothetical protein